MVRTGAGNGRRGAGRFFLWGVVVVLCALPLFPFIRTQLFFHDEAYWLRSTVAFKSYVLERSRKLPGAYADLAIDHPPLGMYIFGAALWLGGHAQDIPALGRLAHTLEDFGPGQPGKEPPAQLLFVGRLTAAFFGLGTCLLLFYLGRRLFDTLTGLCASVILAYHPLFLICSRWVTTDTPLLFFMTLQAVLVLWWLDAVFQSRSRRGMVLGVLVGINSAAAAGVKLNGFLSVAWWGFFGVVLLVSFAEPYLRGSCPGQGGMRGYCADARVRLAAVSLALSVAVCAFVFVAVNPFLYRTPLRRLEDMAVHRMSVVRFQQAREPNSLLNTPRAKWDGMCLQFCGYRNAQPLQAVYNLVLPHSAGLAWTLHLPFLDLYLFWTGFIVLLIAEALRFLRAQPPSGQSVFLAWTAVTLGGTFLWLPMDWGRYYLPLLPGICLMVSAAVVFFLRRSICLLGCRRRLRSTQGTKEGLCSTK